jgi:hypothetical protein
MFQNPSNWDKSIEKPPLRAELYSTEQLDQHAVRIARNHEITHEKSEERLLDALADNERALREVLSLLQQSVKDKKEITPAGEWLLDNYYLIEEQIRMAQKYLPKNFSQSLPKLRNGEYAGYPRVYVIAVELLSHSDCYLSIENLSTFLVAYQKVDYLSIGELWALPIMLRLALIENLRRVADGIARDRYEANIAESWVNKLFKKVEESPRDLVLVIADMAKSNPPLNSAFVAEFTRRIQWKGPSLNLALNWIEQSISENGESINSMVLAENQKKAAYQVSMSNSITSLRLLSKIDWREFVETLSVIEQVLRTDNHGTYSNMDFETRNRYRHVVEEIARNSPLSEKEVAELAVSLTKENQTDTLNHHSRKSHVGYFLLSDGLEQLKKIAGYQLPAFKGFMHWLRKRSKELYFIAAGIITFSITSVFVARSSLHFDSNWGLAIMVFFSLLTASYFAFSIINWWMSLWILPKPLPRMDFSEQIPDEYRTLVAVPTLLAGKEQIKELLYDLEIRYLGNKHDNLFFALVTDYRDADAEVKPGDEELLEAAASGILELNRKYGHHNNDKFFLFHRPRKWNPSEGVWMGYERKRGKLRDLNRLLRGNKEAFSLIIGDERVYTSIKYIITLDSDTQLPRDAAWKMIGLMAHPLNHPIIDEQDMKVVEGYGIIQPRLAISLSGAKRTYFSRMFENDSGIDPYTRVVSDLYQDVFQEGSFIGKGIYDLDAFEKVIDDRFPENRILSHDLLEGSYLRCAYASDVQVFEEYPSSYENDIARRHRWIRGDWQIGLWALPFVVDAKFKIRRNPINLLSRWKILDNLRRSLIPVAFTALLVMGWTILEDAWFWNTFITALLVLPPVFFSLWGIFKKPDEITWKKHFYNSFRNTAKNVVHTLFFILCLPYEAYISLHAIIITLWRLIVTQKKLLEWNPFGLASFKSKTISKAFEKMWVAPVFCVAITIYLILESWVNLLLAAPYLIAWMAFPAIIWVLNKPVTKSKIKQLDNRQKRNLRVLSRKTWAYFESLVGPDTNWLPPDNIQIQPKTVVADRTSPTNIGLMLLANLSAYDFGYLTLSGFVERTRLSLETLGKMERFYGHFYKWYNIQTLEPLRPRYISTVDSGNLGGHLLTLRQGILELLDARLQPNQYTEGVLDTLRVILKLLPINKQENSDFFNQAKKELLYEGNIRQYYQKLKKVKALYQQLIQPINLQENCDLLIWHEKFVQNVEQIELEISSFIPWVTVDNISLEAQQFLLPFTSMTLKEWAWMNIDERLKDYPSPADIRSYLKQSQSRAKEIIQLLAQMAEKCKDFAAMDYDFLYDRSQRLLAIGYNVEEHKRDAGFYDLLASEARLTIFLAIAQGKIPQESWFALGRRLTTVGNTPTLISWSGSMFEYLMPMLVMPTYTNTLLDETMQGCVKKQIEYGKSKDIPWGISESCYNVLDSNLIYQYKAFGVPGLGFKRGLSQDLVIAPYASVMALMVDPVEAYKNIDRMKKAGYEGVYGFYEAVDFTPNRLPKEKREEIIYTFMVHHQGMSLLSLAFALLDQPMQKRFERDPELQTAMLLLQERIPRVSGFYQGSSEVELNKQPEAAIELNIYRTPDTQIPAVQLLSNGNLHTMISNAGGGYTHWKGIALNRWREDGTLDNYGSFLYIRNLDSGEFWSNTFQPTLKKPEYYAADFSYGKAEFHRVDNQIETHTEIIISPEDDVEIRRVRINNQSRNSILLEVTSYSEVVLASDISDMHHSAFSNLFVQTEINHQQHSIICTRRPRSNEEIPPWMFHCMLVSNGVTRKVSFETSRMEFIGRGRSLAHPRSWMPKQNSVARRDMSSTLLWPSERW